MAIIGLKDRETLLKSLRFGNDVKGGGDSGLPYIKTELGDEGGAGSDFLNSLTENTYGDFPIRGNTAAIVKTAEDAIRIGKFSTSFPQGLLFGYKQDGLQRSNPLIQTGKQGGLRNTQQYRVSNTLRQVAVQGSGVHFPRAGVGIKNLQDPQNKYAYIVSHEIKEENRLLNLWYTTNTARENTATSEDLNQFSLSPEASNQRYELGITNGASEGDSTFFRYLGGPGSVYGLGETIISYATDNKGNPSISFSAPKFIGPYQTEEGTQNTPDIYRNNPTFLRKYNVEVTNQKPIISNQSSTINIKDSLLLTNAEVNVEEAPLFIGPYKKSDGKQGRPNPFRSSPWYRGWDRKIINIKDAIDEAKAIKDPDPRPFTERFTNVQQGSLGRASIIPSASALLKSNLLSIYYPELSTSLQPVSKEQTKTGDIKYDGKLDVERRQGFNREFFSNAMSYNLLLAQSQSLAPPSINGKPQPIYVNSDYASRVLDSEGRTNTQYYARENRIKAGGTGKADGINLIPLISDLNNPFYSDTYEYRNEARDLIKFAFETMCNNCEKSTKVHFRAFITSFSDNHTAEWQGTKYAGRGENFYTYQGFERSTQVSFLVAAQSREEMKPLWQKLNFLVSSLYPDYTDNGFMRGNLTRFTLGEYFYRTPGILTNMNITVENDYSWEIKMRSNEGVESDQQMELPMICSINFTFIPILDDLPQRGTKVPIIITNKTTGIQSYLNDPNLIEECLDDQTPSPNPVREDDPEETENENRIALRNYEVNPGNNFNNTALRGADEYNQRLQRDVSRLNRQLDINQYGEEAVLNQLLDDYQNTQDPDIQNNYNNLISQQNQEIVQNLSSFEYTENDFQNLGNNNGN